MKLRALVILLLVVAAGSTAWATGLLLPADAMPQSPHEPAGDSRVVASANDAPGSGETVSPLLAERSAAAPDVAARGVRVMTVDGAGAPVGGAVVRYWPPRSLAWRDAARSLDDVARDLEALLRATGCAATTDASGVAEISGDDGAFVCARAGELYGESHLGSDDDPFGDELRIELRRDVTLRVEVVSADGIPVGGMRVRVDPLYVSTRGFLEGNEDAVVAGPDGVAVVPHLLQRLCEANAIEGRLCVRCVRDVGDRSGVIAEHTMPLLGLEGLVVVRLVVPAAGAILVAITDADGARIDAPCWLEDTAENSFDAPSPDPRGVLFPHVPLQRSWQLRVGEGSAARIVPVRGPRSGGEVVRVDVSLPIRCAELRGRIECRDGRSLSWARVNCRCVAFVKGECDTVTRPDGSLVFRARIDTTAPAADVVELTTDDRRCAPRTWIVNRPIAGGVIELGTFAVEPPAGETLLATVELRRDGLPVRAGGWARIEMDDGRPVASERMRASDGTIVLAGQTPLGAMRLSCGARDCVAINARPIQVGEHVVVDLAPAARLSVAVRAPNAPSSALSAELTAEAGGPSVWSGFDNERQALMFVGVAPGRHRLRLLFHDRVLHEEPAIELHAGSNQWPSDGSRFDLHSCPRVLSFVVRSAAGAGDYLRDWEAMLVLADATELPGELDMLRGPWFVPGQAPSDVFVRAPRHVPMRVASPRHDVQLRLQPSTEFRIDVDAGSRDLAARGRVVEDALQDPLLRDFDTFNLHAGAEFDSSNDVWLVPGTIVELTPWRGTEAEAPQRVVIGTTSPQRVTVR